jgi:hypothetical protein
MKRLTSSFALFSYLVAGVTYALYGALRGAWTNGHVLATAALLGALLIPMVRLSEALERAVHRRTASVFLGLAARYAVEWVYTFTGFGVLRAGGLFDPAEVTALGGSFALFVSAVVLTSTGAKRIALALANRGIGNRIVNLCVAIGANTSWAILVTLGILRAPPAVWLPCAALGYVGMAYAAQTDLMARWAPRGGVGIFFGTFNPVHRAHLELIEAFRRERGLAKVYVHPTLVPPSHRKLLAMGHIEIQAFERGMRIYRKTARADAFIDYFPTGDRFYEADNRLAMLRAGVADLAMDDAITVARFDDAYDARGFHGVVARIRAMHPGQAIHGMHGSDVGGMMVRAIYDECPLVWPFAIVRTDAVSSTKIRAGATSLTTPSVRAILRFLADGERRDGDLLRLRDRVYEYRGGTLIPAGDREASHAA